MVLHRVYVHIEQAGKWASIAKVVGSTPIVARHVMQPARYALTVTPETSYIHLSNYNTSTHGIFCLRSKFDGRFFYDSSTLHEQIELS